MIAIRAVQIQDAEGLIDVNIKTWQSAYKGIINDATLTALNDNRDARVERYKNEFGTRNVDGVIMQGAVALDKGEVIGFTTYGKARENPDGIKDLGEIYALYVLKAYQGQGVGLELVQFAVDNMIEKKRYKELIIWALKDNPSRGFYERLGGVKKYHKVIEIAGQSLDEVGYLYEDISNILKAGKL